jgi:hypothetical protein
MAAFLVEQAPKRRMGTVQGRGDRSRANAKSDADRRVVEICLVAEEDDQTLTLR